ncbi:PREDICTED: uncharacterized protein LOC108564420 [Nicrophorus vespilloides]|uniref:Uncharacterized protein LOC108564420 n=1 Tax=Nicrophorus vespilloides TaxID=110193 RepID=A0ABM1MWK7_NICVS|nr:PREDICTED: uncharacterized protein LOC108564420 [Nicrophorus vespilloides]
MDTFEMFDLELDFQMRHITVEGEKVTLCLNKLTDDGIYLQTTFIKNVVIYKHIDLCPHSGLMTVIYEYSKYYEGFDVERNYPDEMMYTQDFEEQAVVRNKVGLGDACKMEIHEDEN